MPNRLVVDDQLLLDLLTETHPLWLVDELQRSTAYPTGSWYHRVALAMRRGTRVGSLSSRLTTLDPDRQRAVLEKLGTFPQWIGRIGSRVLVPEMADLSVGRRPNLVTAEALAVARSPTAPPSCPSSHRSCTTAPTISACGVGVVAFGRNPGGGHRWVWNVSTGTRRTGGAVRDRDAALYT